MNELQYVQVADDSVCHGFCGWITGYDENRTVIRMPGGALWITDQFDRISPDEYRRWYNDVLFQAHERAGRMSDGIQ